MRSSHRITAEQSTLARRAISSVSNWSHNFQPSRLASSAAMAPPPQPYSRSMLIRRNMATPLVYRELVYRDSAAGPAFFHQKDQGNHRQDGYAEKPKVIEIGEHGGLALHRAFDQGIGLLGGK